jgi:hypothetical protein
MRRCEIVSVKIRGQPQPKSWLSHNSADGTLLLTAHRIATHRTPRRPIAMQASATRAPHAAAAPARAAAPRGAAPRRAAAAPRCAAAPREPAAADPEPASRR